MVEEVLELVLDTDVDVLEVEVLVEVEKLVEVLETDVEELKLELVELMLVEVL